MSVRSHVEALSPRVHLFAHPLVEGDAVKRFVAMTDDSVYFATQPTDVANSKADDRRTFARVAVGGGKVRTLTPASGTWDLSELDGTRAIGDGTVLMNFGDGSLWAAHDGSSEVDKLASYGVLLEDALAQGTVAGGRFYFAADDGNGREAFVTDGTAKGTVALPQLREGSADAFPRGFAAIGDDVLLAASIDGVTGDRLVRWDGKAFSRVPGLAKRTIDAFAVTKGRVVAAAEGTLYALSSDLKRTTVLATNVGNVERLTPMGGGVAFLGGDAVYRSDLTAAGTRRIGDAPVTAHDGPLTDVRFDPAGFLIHAYNGATAYTSGSSLGGTMISIGNAIDTTGSLATTGGTLHLSSTRSSLATLATTSPVGVLRVGRSSLTRVLDGSFGESQRLGDATYFVSGSNPDGSVVRLDDDGDVSTLRVNGYASRSTTNGDAIAFTGGGYGTTLYAIDPNDETGVVYGSAVRDRDFDRKVDDADPAITAGEAFADYDDDGRRDSGEPQASLDDDGHFLLSGLRAGKVRIVASLGKAYAGGAVRQFVTVQAREVLDPTLLATPLTSAIRVETFVDVDGDGTRDAAERGADGLSAYLDLDDDGKLDAGEPTATTDAAGVARFDYLAAGTYRVRVRSSRAADRFTTIAKTTRQVDADASVTARFGVQREAATGGIKGQLVSELISRGFSDAQVQLYAGDTLVATTNANVTGGFRFEALPAGDYTLRTVVAGRYEAGEAYDVPVRSDATAKASLAIPVSQSIYGRVFYDLNENGRHEGDEPYARGVRVTISTTLDRTGTTMLTDANGAYELFARREVANDTAFDIDVATVDGIELYGQAISSFADERTDGRHAIDVSLDQPPL